MKRLLAVAFVIPAMVALAGCGGGAANTANPGGGTTEPGATVGGPAATTQAGPATPEPAATEDTGGTTTEIPADCAAGFVEYLKAIEPITDGFDPATGTMAELGTLDQAIGMKGFELMDANGGSATYSCSDVGLEFNYFDMRSPWAAIHQLAAAQAPGTAGYLQATEEVSALDDDLIADHGMASCEEAAAKIKADVKKAMAAGTDTMDGMFVQDAAPLLGLYNAYNTEVREGRCTNELGNDEFGFMSIY
jgi:hypothetical protein